MSRTLVISAFPGCGKSFATNELKRFMILDSDSSHFSWVKDENGKNTKERNPEFPKNYIKHIENNIGEVDIIFVSTHKEVRDGLDEKGIKYYIVKPEKNMKEDFINRYRERGSNESFIKLLDTNWDNWLDELVSKNDPNEERIIYLNEEKPYMKDVINDIAFSDVLEEHYYIDESPILESMFEGVTDDMWINAICESGYMTNQALRELSE